MKEPRFEDVPFSNDATKAVERIIDGDDGNE